MKEILFLFSTLILNQTNAQKLRTIPTNEREVVALFFPDEIRQAIVGSPEFTFSYNKEHPQHVGLLQGVKGSESNLLVITATDEVYSYKLKFLNNLDTLNYFIFRNERIGFESSLFTPTIKSPVSVLKDSVKMKTPRNDFPNRLEYFKKFSEFHLKHNRNSLKRKVKKGVVLHLRDLIYDRTEVYVFIEIKNRSGIDFEMDYLKVFKVNGNKRKKSSYQKIEIGPIYEHNLPKLIKGGERQSFVLTVPKFTFGDQEKLLLELKEHRGNRILQLFYY
ncbi:DUF4138 domain-containing protein [Euzebyella saccharophila]|uniref:DUF4138 domain-containing protein n=1 Tax=Euzebyella saccharophila TaxID=679664 RepID=A0ABV8JJ95_9FLAO|nr:DUF4138 domain-containing protein [Euzebyella saccharophila]